MKSFSFVQALPKYVYHYYLFIRHMDKFIPKLLKKLMCCHFLLLYLWFIFPVINFHCFLLFVFVCQSEELGGKTLTALAHQGGKPINSRGQLYAMRNFIGVDCYWYDNPANPNFESEITTAHPKMNLDMRLVNKPRIFRLPVHF